MSEKIRSFCRNYIPSILLTLLLSVELGGSLARQTEKVPNSDRGIIQMALFQPSPPSTFGRIVLGKIFPILGCSDYDSVTMSVNGRTAGVEGAGSGKCIGIAVWAFDSDEDAQGVFNNYKLEPSCPDDNGYSWYKIPNAFVRLTPVGAQDYPTKKTANYDIDRINQGLSKLSPSDSFRTMC